MSDSRVPLTIALAAYSHAYELRSGAVGLAGIRPSFVEEGAADADVHELPLADYVAGRADGDVTVTALPVFLSRGFVHSWIYVGSGHVSAPEPDRTVAIYVRGLLQERGEDASVVIAPPRCGCAGLRPRFERAGEVEREYYAQTGVFPIFRVVVVRTELLDRYRWLASNLYRAFEVARRRYFARLEDIRGSRVPIPSVADHLMALRQSLGYDVWPYGLEPNRATLEAFVRYATEQALISGPADVSDLFARVEPFVDVTDGV
ncbi:MAG TPA: hypothetical protein VME22_13520 [Solirubrobacteraceae bacterium]|nr:hypothetical protein [Solirubrobacteraceae bacterium]